MVRFNTPGNRARNPGPRSAIQTVNNPFTGDPVRKSTALGASGYQRDAKSELFLLAVSFMGGDTILHEKSADRYNRLIGLIGQHDVYSDLVWCRDFVNYLRNDAQMRTVSIVIAVEVVRARLLTEMTDPVVVTGNVTITNRNLIDVACSRADEPCEVLAYYTSQYGQSKWDNKMIPQPILNGAGDAAVRLWNEFSVLKYGGGEGKKSFTMKDLLRLVHPKPTTIMQSALFAWIAGTKGQFNGEAFEPLPLLPMITARQVMQAVPREERISWLIGDSNVAK